MVNFERFERAVHLNQNSEYTLCDFLYLVKCIMMDIDDTCGSVENLPVGDNDKFGDLMTNQCCMLADIIDAVRGRQSKANERYDEISRDLSALQVQFNQYIELFKSIDEMKSKKKELEKQLSDFSTKKAEFDKLTEDIISVEQSIAEADHFDLKATKKSLEDLQNELNSKTKNSADLIRRINECKAKHNKALNDEETAKKQLLDLEEALKDTENNLKELENSVNQKQNEKEAMKKTTDALSDTLEELKGEIAVYAAKSEEFGNIFRQEKERMSDENRIVINEVERLVETVGELKKAKHTAEEQQEQLNKDKVALEKNANAIKTMVDSLNKSNKEYADKIEDFSIIFKSTRDELSEAHKTLLDEIEAIGKKIAQLSIQIHQKSERKERLTARLEAAQNNYTVLEGDVYVLEIKEKEYEEKFESYACIFEKSKSQLSEKNQKISEEILNIAKNISELRIKFQKLNEEKNKKKQEVERLNQYIERVNRIVNKLKGDMLSLEVLYDELETDKEHNMYQAKTKLESDYRQMYEEYHQFCYNTLKPQLDNNGRIKEKIKNKDEELQSAITKNDKLKEQFDQLNSELSKYTKLNEELQNNINRQKINIDPVEQKYTKLYEENKTVNDKIDRLTIRNQQLETELIPQAQHTLESIDDIRKSREKTIIEKTSAICVLMEQQNAELIENMSELDSKMEKVFGELTSIRKQYEEKISRISKYSKEINDKQSQIRDLEKQDEQGQREGAIQQLNDKIDELKKTIENRNREIEILNDSIIQLVNDEEKLKTKKDELDKQRNTIENTKNELQRDISNLHILLGNDYESQLKKLKDKIGLLSPLYNNLNIMLGYISEITGGSYIKNQIESYNRALSDLKNILPNIHKYLLDSAENLQKLMIMEEK